MQRKLISIVMPAYNEEVNVGHMHQALERIFSEALSAYDAEFIFVNDGSMDETVTAVKKLTQADPRVKLVSLSRNFGHQAALSAGIERASGQAVITMDCDLQDPPGLLPEMVAKWEAGNVVVYARRRKRVDTFFKKVTASLYYRLVDRMSDIKIPHQVGDFRLMDHTVQQELMSLKEHARYLRGLVAWLGHKHDFVDYDRPNREEGETRYTLVKMVRLAMDGLLSFSMLPLRFGFWIGAMALMLAAVFFVYIFYQHFIVGVYYQLYKWMIVIMFGFMGLQFMFMWVMGEYIGRIYKDVKNRPLFIVSETVNFD